ncbi:unnamed protein product [Peniophora sp. CBMAI 1063]|nr:unnamed protein product [Peniophora sp. CBMAI 1063]
MSDSELSNAGDYAALANLQHVACGLYIWEWVSNLDYEFQYFFGKPTRRRWTMWVYVLCRYFTLGFIINLLIVLNTRLSLNCIAWIRFQLLLPYMGILMASFLIVIRAVAIWNRHRVVMVIAVTSLLAQLSILIHSVAIAKAIWDVETQTCVLINNIPTSLPMLSAVFAIDAFQLLVTLVGLYVRREGRGFGMWDLLWKQGLAWLALAAAAELPTVIILTLNLNEALHQLLQTPEVIILALAATSMYRMLTCYSSASCDSPSQDSRTIELGAFRAADVRASRTNCLGNAEHIRTVEIEIQVDREARLA